MAVAWYAIHKERHRRISTPASGQPARYVRANSAQLPNVTTSKDSPRDSSHNSYLSTTIFRFLRAAPLFALSTGCVPPDELVLMKAHPTKNTHTPPRSNTRKTPRATTTTTTQPPTTPAQTTQKDALYTTHRNTTHHRHRHHLHTFDQSLPPRSCRSTFLPRLCDMWYIKEVTSCWSSRYPLVGCWLSLSP